MKRLFSFLILIFAVVCIFPPSCAAQTDNTLYAKQFPGVTVGVKVQAAMAACNPNTAIPCIIVLDPSLAVWAQGTIPALCAQCSLQDYRTGPSGSFNAVVAATSTIGIANGIYNASQFGVKCDGGTDDSAALNAIGTFAAGISAGKTITVNFPSNAICIQAGEITTWGVKNLHIYGNGSRLKFTGTGTSTNGQIFLNPGPGNIETNVVDNLVIDGFVLQGNANSTWGIYQALNSLIAHSTFRLLNVQDQNIGCYYFPNVELSKELYLPCSENIALFMGVAQTTQPRYGLIAGYSSETTPVANIFANNRSVNVTIEGVGVIGLWCVTCQNENHFFGTAEGVSSAGGTVGVGLQDYTTVNDGQSSGNTFSMDDESDAVADANISGTAETLLGFDGGALVNLNGGYGSIIGGQFQNIVENPNTTSGWLFSGFKINRYVTTGAITGINTKQDLEIGVYNPSTGLLSQYPSQMPIGVSDGSTGQWEHVLSYSTIGANTGTLEIKLPAARRFSNTYQTYRILMYNSGANQVGEVLIGGYTYSGAGGWWNNGAVSVSGSMPFTSVRLADDGTNNVILLGTTSSGWSGLVFSVDVLTSYGSYSTGWQTGWSSAFLTSEAGITVMATPIIKTTMNGDLVNANGTVIPLTATGYTGASAGKVVLSTGTGYSGTCASTTALTVVNGIITGCS